MKKILYLTPIVMFLCCTKAFAQYEGTFGMGLHTGYATGEKSPAAGLHLHYYHSDRLRVAPSFTYYLPAQGRTTWEVDADLHYIIPVSWVVSLYPVAGINYSNRMFDASKSEGEYAQDQTKHRFGANLGAGVQYDIKYKIRANFEVKYQFINDFSQISFMVGIGFWI